MQVNFVAACYEFTSLVILSGNKQRCFLAILHFKVSLTVITLPWNHKQNWSEISDMPDFGEFVSLLAKFTLKFVVKETLSILRESNPKKQKCKACFWYSLFGSGQIKVGCHKSKWFKPCQETFHSLKWNVLEFYWNFSNPDKENRIKFKPLHMPSLLDCTLDQVIDNMDKPITRNFKETVWGYWVWKHTFWRIHLIHPISYSYSDIHVRSQMAKHTQK